MPSALRVGPYRLFFYSADGAEPPHIHIECEGKIAKFWLDPVRLEASGWFSRTDVNTLARIVAENREELLRKWNESFHD